MEKRSGVSRPLYPPALQRSDGASNYPEAGLLTHRSLRFGNLPVPLQNSGFTSRSARCSQWRDRAGFTPASLFTHRRRRAPRTDLWLTQLAIAVNDERFDIVNPARASTRYRFLGPVPFL